MSLLFLGPIVIIPATANNMTGTSVLTSLVADMRQRHASSFQMIWTGTPVGSFSIQGSLDYAENSAGAVMTAGTWNDLGITVSAPAGSASAVVVDISLTGIPYMRLVYTNASGSGALKALVFGK